MAEIRVQDLQKRFGDFIAVRSSSFVVPNGAFFCLLGPSGCGKTTTLRMIAGLELPTEGKITLGGEDVTFRRAAQRDIAFVFQLFALYPHMNVRANIGFPLKCQGMPKREIASAVEEAARILRIDHLLEKPVSGLSGGDRQRVALGRAIVRKPMAFMMDEPLGALDAEFRALMCQELRALHDRLGATTVYVTHDQLEAMAMADRIAIMNQGVIEQLGTPREVYERPASMFVADFIGSPPTNFLPVQASIAPGDRSVPLDGVTVEIPECRQAAGPDLILGARPEHVRLMSEGGVRGEVFGVEYLGTTQIVTVRTGLATVKARLGSEIAVRPGSSVGLGFKAERLSLFDRRSGRAIRTELHDGGAHG